MTRYFFLITMMVMAAYGQTSLATGNWQDQVKAFYVRCHCELPGQGVQPLKANDTSVATGGITSLAQSPVVLLSTNTGRIASPGSPVQVKVHIPVDYNFPVNMFGHFQIRQPGQSYRTVNYYAPQGSMWGRFDRLQSSSFVLADVAMPTNFGDQMLFDLVITDPYGGFIDQKFAEVTFGGATDGVESMAWHLDGVTNFGNYVQVKGVLPPNVPVSMMFGDRRSNSSGPISAKSPDGQSVSIPMTSIALGTTYPFGMDVILCVYQFCHTLPNGLVFNTTNNNTATSGPTPRP